MVNRELEIITLTKDNIDSEHICCAIGNDATNVKEQKLKNMVERKISKGHTLKSSI